MERYNEEELLYLMRQGCPIARETLCKQYYAYITMMVRNMNITAMPVEESDLVQEALLACFQGIDGYRPDKECLLKTFVVRIVKNKIMTVLKRFNLNKERIYNNAMSLDAPLKQEEHFRYEDIIGDSKIHYQPNRKLLVKEEVIKYQNLLEEHCSSFEQQVIYYRMEGYSHKEIAKVLDVDIKMIYNALYRLQKKMKQLKSI